MNNLSLFNEKSSLFAECFRKLERTGDNTFECVVWERPMSKTPGVLIHADNINRASYAFLGETPFEAMEKAYSWLRERHSVNL